MTDMDGGLEAVHMREGAVLTQLGLKRNSGYYIDQSEDLMRGLIRSFGYAFRGIFYTLKHERNMRIHFVCMIYVFFFADGETFLRLQRTQFAIIFLANALVVSLELVNTAVERTVDLASTEWTDNTAGRQRIRGRSRFGIGNICRSHGNYDKCGSQRPFRHFMFYFKAHIIFCAVSFLSLVVAFIFYI